MISVAKRLLALLCGIILLGNLCGCALAGLYQLGEGITAAIPDPAIPLEERSSGRFTYKTAGGVDLSINVAQPFRDIYPKSPIILSIHGGNWAFNPIGDPHVPALPDTNNLRMEGWASVAINYRGFEHGGSLSDLLGDLVDGLGYINEHNDEFVMDLERIVVIGQSAGGHTGLLLALAPQSLLMQSANHTDFSFRAIGCIALVPPTIMGEDAYSPLNHIRKDMPPVMIVGAEKDTVVSPVNSYRFYNEARNVGADCTLIMLKNANHAFQAVGGEIDPPLSEYYDSAYAFVQDCIK